MAVFLSDHHHHHHYRGKERRAQGLRREKSWDRTGGHVMAKRGKAWHVYGSGIRHRHGMARHGARGTGHGHGASRYGTARQRHKLRCSWRFCSVFVPLFVRYLLLPGVSSDSFG